LIKSEVSECSRRAIIVQLPPPSPQHLSPLNLSFHIPLKAPCLGEKDTLNRISGQTSDGVQRGREWRVGAIADIVKGFLHQEVKK